MGVVFDFEEKIMGKFKILGKIVVLCFSCDEDFFLEKSQLRIPKKVKRTSGSVFCNFHSQNEP